MNSKFAVILLAIIPVIQCGSLSPDNLQRHFSLIDANLNTKIANARNEIESYIALFGSYYTNITEDSLADDLEAASASYWSQLLSLEVDAAEKDISVANCVLNSVEQFDLLLNKTLGEYNDTLNGIVDTERSKENEAEAVLNKVDQDLSDFKKDVNECSSEACGTELNSKLADLYELSSKNIDDALSSIVNYVIVDAPNSLENVTIDASKFQEDLEPLLAAAKACFD